MLATTLFVSFLAVVSAAPTNGSGESEAREICGNGNTAHCCNGDTAQKVTRSSGFLTGAELGNLLGECNDVTTAVLGGAASLKNACTMQSVCCDNVKQDGLVNFSCSNINV